MSEYSEGLRIVTSLGERCTAVPLQVQESDKTKLEVLENSYKIRREVHSSATAGARECQNEVRGAWRCQSTVKG